MLFYSAVCPFCDNLNVIILKILRYRQFRTFYDLTTIINIRLVGAERYFNSKYMDAKHGVETNTKNVKCQEIWRVRLRLNPSDTEL